MAEVGPGVELDLCDPNCGTIDCHSYGCVINCSEAPNVGNEPEIVLAESAKPNSWTLSERDRRNDRAGFVKTTI